MKNKKNRNIHNSKTDKREESVDSRRLSPIEVLINNSDMKCTKCGAKAGKCDCWSKFPVVGCSWFVEKGHKCRNPNHQ